MKKIKSSIDETKSKSNFYEYEKTFIQRIPRYTVKFKGDNGWKTKKKPLANILVKSHLLQKYIIGVLGKWYPEYSILDSDNVTIEEVERIRDSLGLNSSNSMLCTSESPDSYHLLIRPAYNHKPPTIRLLQDTFKQFGKQNNIEIYPQSHRTIRLPFGFNQECLDFEYISLKDWQEKLFWFLKLDDFDLSTIPNQQKELDLTYKNPNLSNVFEEGKDLLRNGLQISNSRHDAQFKVLYYLWRMNIPIDEAIKLVWLLIKEKNNGFSKDIITYPTTVKGEINRQAGRIYNTYEHAEIYPDETHNEHNGYITRADIADIIRVSKANSPRMKFIFNLIKYCYPRKQRNFLNIHSNKLIEWSSRENYNQYLEELHKLGIIKRGKSYLVDKFSKSITIDWKFRDPKEAILYDGRSPDSFEATIKLSYEPEEIKALLLNAGSERTTAIKMVNRFYESVKKGETYR